MTTLAAPADVVAGYRQLAAVTARITATRARIDALNMRRRACFVRLLERGARQAEIAARSGLTDQAVAFQTDDPPDPVLLAALDLPVEQLWVELDRTVAKLDRTATGSSRRLSRLYQQRADLFAVLLAAGETKAALARAAGVSPMAVKFAVKKRES